MEPLHQVLYNVEVKGKKNLSEFPEIEKRIKESEKSFDDSGRILIRYSGREPLQRIMVEGEDETKLQWFGQGLVGLAKKYLRKWEVDLKNFQLFTFQTQVKGKNHAEIGRQH